MKYSILFLVMSMFTCAVMAQPIRVTILTDDNNYPYSYIDKHDGKLKGGYVAIVKAVFAKMPDYQVTLEPVPWKRGKEMMKNGTGFWLATAYFHGHDWPYLYPYSLPFATDILNVYCLDNLLKKPRKVWPRDYKYLTFGRPAGYGGWGGDKFDAMVKSNEIKLEESAGVNKQVMKLDAGRIDCIILDENSFNVEKLENSNIKWNKIVKGAQISKNDVYIGYSKKAIESGQYPFQMDFRQKFDSELYKMIISGERDQIFSVNLSVLHKAK